MSLTDLHARLSQVCESIQAFGVPLQPPVIDPLSSPQSDMQALPGLRYLREEVRRDYEALDKCLRRHAEPIALSTNAPYLFAVWDELIHARQPVAIYRMFSIASAKGGAKTRKLPPRGKNAPKIQTRTVKVDVVAENGARWVRVNTITNSRLMAEFHEIDSYLTSDDDDELGPRLAQPGCDNSVLRMGRNLLAAAKANPISASIPDLNSTISNPDSLSVTPRVTIRLTRLHLLRDDSSDPRINETIRCLRDMGIDVQLGEWPFPPPMPIQNMLTSSRLEPTTSVNLDLSMLVALISDISHSPLPRTKEEAHARFVPPQSYLDWKKGRSKSFAHQNQSGSPLLCDTESGENEDTWEYSGQHSRALAAQAAQEMDKGILEEIHKHLSEVLGNLPIASSSVAFWTTSEARHRCLQIVSKIGGEKERRRADALLGSTLCSRMPSIPTPMSHLNGSRATNDARVEVTSAMHGTEGIVPLGAYWEHSRYPAGFLPLTPVHIYPSILPAEENEDRRSSTSFFDALARTCAGILSHEVDSMSQVSVSSDPLPANTEEALEEIPPAARTKLPKLTAHTARSMLAGASRRHTTLTTNRSSVKAVLKEIRSVCAKGGYEAETGNVRKAALWTLDPRSLSECMRSQ